MTDVDFVYLLAWDLDRDSTATLVWAHKRALWGLGPLCRKPAIWLVTGVSLTAVKCHQIQDVREGQGKTTL